MGLSILLVFIPYRLDFFTTTKTLIRLHPSPAHVFIGHESTLAQLEFH